MNRVYDDEDNVPMDDNLFIKDVYGILRDIRTAANGSTIEGSEVKNDA